MTRRHLYLGISLITAAFFFAAIRSAISKVLLREGMTVEILLFFQSLIALLCLLPWILKGGAGKLAVKDLKFLSLRSMAGFAAFYCFILALKFTSLAKTVLLNNSAPLFIPLILAVWLHRKIDKYVAGVLILGFIGIMLVLKPSVREVYFGDILALVSGIFAAFSMIYLRIIGRRKSEHPSAVIFYYLLLIIGLSALIALSGGRWTLYRIEVLWPYLIATGILYAFFQICFTMAFYFAPAKKISPFIYFGVVFAGLIDWVVWKQAPGLISASGMALVVTGAVLLIVRERRILPDVSESP